MLTWLWLVSFPTFPENDFCFTISDDLFPQIHVDLKKKNLKSGYLLKRRTSWNELQWARNDLKWTTTIKKRSETAYNKQDTIWNDLQRARNDLKQTTTTKKWLKTTYNEQETI